MRLSLCPHATLARCAPGGRDEQDLSWFVDNEVSRKLLAVRGVGAPVDATRVPADLPGFRTMFSCLHHFRPAQAEAILRDAFERRRGIGIFEVTERAPLGLAQAFMSPIPVVFLTPFVRPLRLSRFALTYLLPLVPALFMFDGVVSNLRTYTQDELRAMTAPLRRADYRWEIGQARHPILPTKVTYVIGLPRRAA